MDETYRANYALLPVLEHLGPAADSLDVEWAEFVGNRSSGHEFTVSAADAKDAYVELQAYDVGEFGHEIVLDGEPLPGFDLPPGDGWQYWMDSIGDRELAGTHTLHVRRDTTGEDAFAVGNVVVNWREPV
ncbi:MAG: hypothetical protein ABEI96_09210 [Haloarculaceae archaeon]